ncbi:MAG: membrane protein insertase YidC [Bacteroidales bacterium]|nr:membrane protein insertase YidC [Bacteroidales bacterium]
MNKNSLIGIILIIGILVGWMIWSTPSKEEIARQRHIQDSIIKANRARYIEDSIHLAEVQKQAEMAQTQNSQASTVSISRDKYGVFTTTAEGEEKDYILENDVLKLTVSSKGAYVKTVQLKDYRTWDSLPLIGFDENTTRFGVSFFAANRYVTTSDLYFKPFLNGYEYDGEASLVVKDNPLVFSLRAYADDNTDNLNLSEYIEFTYTLTKDEYMVDFDVKTINMKDIIGASTNFITIDWYADILKQEKAVDRFNGSNVYYRINNSDVESLSGDRGGEKDGEKDIRSNIKWLSFKQRFFSYSLISKDFFNSAMVGMKTDYKQNNPRYLKTMYASVDVPFDGFKADNHLPMQFYFGPNSLKILDKYDIGLDKQIHLGGKLVGWINRLIVVNVFNWLGSYGWNYGIVILVLTLIIKICLMPFAYKSYLSTAKMRVLKPEIDEINAKFPDEKDNMKKQQAIMDLYKRAGASPTSGCLPMLLQLPILWAIFRFFPASIELRQQPFLWADDLSTYDSILDLGFNIPFYGDHVSLFTLLMTITTILYTYINNKQMAATQQQGMKGMKIMMYLMPIMFLGLFNSYSAGLSYYYMLVNIITFLQMYLFRVFLDDDKLRKQIELAKQKPVKKSGFQKRLEEMQKQQQQMQRRK